MSSSSLPPISRQNLICLQELPSCSIYRARGKRVGFDEAVCHRALKVLRRPAAYQQMMHGMPFDLGDGIYLGRNAGQQAAGDRAEDRDACVALIAAMKLRTRKRNTKPGGEPLGLQVRKRQGEAIRPQKRRRRRNAKPRPAAPPPQAVAVPLRMHVWQPPQIQFQACNAPLNIGDLGIYNGQTCLVRRHNRGEDLAAFALLDCRSALGQTFTRGTTVEVELETGNTKWGRSTSGLLHAPLHFEKYAEGAISLNHDLPCIEAGLKAGDRYAFGAESKPSMVRAEGQELRIQTRLLSNPIGGGQRNNKLVYAYDPRSGQLSYTQKSMVASFLRWMAPEGQTSVTILGRKEQPNLVLREREVVVRLIPRSPDGSPNLNGILRLPVDRSIGKKPICKGFHLLLRRVVEATCQANRWRLDVAREPQLKLRHIGPRQAKVSHRTGNDRIVSVQHKQGEMPTIKVPNIYPIDTSGIHFGSGLKPVELQVDTQHGMTLQWSEREIALIRLIAPNDATEVDIQPGSDGPLVRQTVQHKGKPYQVQFDFNMWKRHGVGRYIEVIPATGEPLSQPKRLYYSEKRGKFSLEARRKR